MFSKLEMPKVWWAIIVLGIMYGTAIAISLIYGFGLAAIALTIIAIRFTTAHLRNRQERKEP